MPVNSITHPCSRKSRRKTERFRLFKLDARSKLLPTFAKLKVLLAERGNRKVLALAAFSFLVLAVLQETPYGYSLESLVARRLEFATRSALSLDPDLDPRLKIFEFDSTTLNEMGRDDLELAEWAKIFVALGDRKPKIILVDKVFATPRGLSEGDAFLASMAQAKVPVVVGSYAERQSYLKKNDVRPGKDSLPLDPPWLEAAAGVVIGPHESIRAAFKLGHNNVEEFGYVKPFQRLDQRAVVPNWSLLAAESVRLDGKRLLVNDHPISLDQRNLIVPNLVSLKAMGARSLKLLSVIYRSQHEMPIESVQEGDIVILLPAMYPGNKDWVDTPRGREPGGYLMTSLVNSVLSGNWLRVVGGGLPLLALMCFIGTLVASRFGSLVTSMILAGLAAVLALGGVATFAAFGVVLPWLFPSFGVLLSGTLVSNERARQQELRLNNLKTMLRGRLSTARIDQIARDPSVLQSAPTGSVVSVMFIDIVGFSQVAERQTPEEAFMNLKELFALLRGLVLDSNGIVDKTLGDGMLCYFGYGLDGQKQSGSHADEALACAIKIQAAVLVKNLEAARKKVALYPLRIGINTAAVVIGNIGDAAHFDFTMIGDGVNLAKRLESACQHYAIMIGSPTFDLLLNSDNLPGQLVKRFIPIKHHVEPLESYEYNPFFDQEEVIEGVNDAYRRSLGIDRQDARWPVPLGVSILLDSQIGTGRVFDFSHSGFGVILEKYIGSGIQVEFTFSEETGCEELKGLTLVGEVRWGKPVKHGYLHGILIKNLSAPQKDLLVATLRAKVREGTDRGQLSA